jgi:hypothetical protein
VLPASENLTKTGCEQLQQNRILTQSLPSTLAIDIGLRSELATIKSKKARP